MGAGSLVVNGGARVVALLGYAALYVLAPWQLDTGHWATWVFAIVAVDLLFYAEHRAAHRVRILWAAHQAHHNSQRFNLSTAVRQKWNPWWELLVWTPLPLLGMPPAMIFTAFSVNLIFQFFVHTERIDRMWKPVEFVFNTPSHHRVHHGSDPEYLDKNYAGILIIWDRMFRSYAEETHRPTYGLTKNIDSYNPFKLQYHLYGAIARDVRAARSWRDGSATSSPRPVGRPPCRRRGPSSRWSPRRPGEASAGEDQVERRVGARPVRVVREHRDLEGALDPDGDESDVVAEYTVAE